MLPLQTFPKKQTSVSVSEYSYSHSPSSSRSSWSGMLFIKSSWFWVGRGGSLKGRFSIMGDNYDVNIFEDTAPEALGLYAQSYQGPN